MSINEIEDFLKANGPLAIAIVIVVFPIAWAIFDQLYKHRMEEEKSKVKHLEGEIDDLKKASANSHPIFPLNQQFKYFPKITQESEDDLISRIKGAKKQIRILGLTRNFYADGNMQALLIGKAREIPVKFFIMDPDCDSRKDRYRVEPSEAAFDSVKKYKLSIEAIFVKLLSQTPESIPLKSNAGLCFYYYNFPCSFAIDQFDDVCRVSLYGLFKQGRDSPIWVYDKQDPHGTSAYDYFASQLDWIEGLAAGKCPPDVNARKLKIRQLKGHDTDRSLKPS